MRDILLFYFVDGNECRHNPIYWYRYEIFAKVSGDGDFAIPPTQEML
jgi:hypothetical protein